MPSSRYKTNYLIPTLMLMAGAFLLYANTFGNAWTYDDFPVIVDNPDVRSLVDFFRNSYPGRPLREITYLLDHAFFGLNPAGWHIQNIFWHGMNAVLVFVLLCRLRVGSWVAWASALIFLVHPIQVEVVANISHRKDSLILCLVLIAVLCYMQACEKNRHRVLWVLGALSAWSAALLAKENAIVLPLILLAYEYAFVVNSQRILLKRRIFCAGTVMAALLGGMFWYGHFVNQSNFYEEITRLLQSKANYFDGAALGLYYRMVLKSWMYMLGKVIYPVNLALEYTYPIPSSWLDPWVLFAFLILILYGTGVWFSARSNPHVFFGLIWMGGFFLPVANLWPLSYFAADRYFYAPMVGICLLFSLLIRWIFTQPVVRNLLLAGLLAVLTSLTWQQNHIWKNPETLWTQANRVSPKSAYALNNLGNVHFLKGDLLKARDFYSQAVVINPMNATAHYNLGLIYERVGLLSEAMAHFKQFLAIDDLKFKDQAQALRIRLEARSRKMF